MESMCRETMLFINFVPFAINIGYKGLSGKNGEGNERTLFDRLFYREV